jgi:cytochrome P450 family 110
MLPPGSSAPGFVQMLRWMRSPAGSLEAEGARWGDAFSSRNPLFGTCANFSHPDAVKEIFTGDPSVFRAGEAYEMLGLYLGSQSVLLLDDAAHLHVRRLMLPAFHGERMLHYTALMRDATRRAVEALRPGQCVELHALFQDVTLEVILRAVLGLDDGPDLDTARRQLTGMLGRVQSPSGLIWSKRALQKDLGWLTPWAGLKREIEVTDRLLLGHIDAHRKGRGNPDDVLSMLVAAVDEEGRGLDDRTLRDQIMTLLLAGHETTATTLSWAFEEILRVPGEQDRLIAEATAVLAGAPVEAAHLPRLERIDSVIKEVLRLHPVIGAVARRLKQPATVGGYDLPAGIMAVAVMHLTHRRPDLYPDPDRFVGDRFIGKKVDPYAWAPFGGGIRRCLGMAFALHEMKVMLATMFGMGLRLELTEKGPPVTTLRVVVYAPRGETRVLVKGKGGQGMGGQARATA